MLSFPHQKYVRHCFIIHYSSKFHYIEMLRKKSLFSCEKLQLSLFRSNFQEKTQKRTEVVFNQSNIHKNISSQNFDVRNGPKSHFPPYFSLYLTMYRFSFSGTPYHSTHSQKPSKWRSLKMMSFDTIPDLIELRLGHKNEVFLK